MTVIGEIKALLDDLDLEAVYRYGWVPEGASLPYATILWPVTSVALLQGDAQILKRRDTAQVDVWQEEKNEDDALLQSVVSALGGQVLNSGGRVRVTNVLWVTDELDPDVVHHAVTLSFPRSS